MVQSSNSLPDSGDVPLSKKINLALMLQRAGFTIIPVHADTKVPIGKWSDWEQDQSEDRLRAHYSQHPEHDVGIITDAGLIVFDADSPQAVEALHGLEQLHGIAPSWVVQTRKGEHHYFLRPPEVFARQDSHSTDQHPERIDIKTDRSLVIGPGSRNKTILRLDCNHRSELNPATQAFVDAVFEHNGRPAPRAAAVPPPRSTFEATSNHLPHRAELQAMLNCISAEDYKTWIDVGMALHHETDGSEDGYQLWDGWSQSVSNYAGSQQTRYKWQSFRHCSGQPMTVGTLVHLARKGGYADGFTPCETEVIVAPAVSDVAEPSGAAEPVDPTATEHPLARYSLRDRVDEIEPLVLQEKLVLGHLLVDGQSGVIYAAPNTGKTLIVLHLLVADIADGRLDPNRVYYLNMDDNSSGLLQKLKLAQEYRFHMLAEGHAGFTVSSFEAVIEKLIATDQARGTIIVLDTLTKFADTMSKSQTRQFTTLMRRFVLKGGTVLALAHTNKNPGPDGKPVIAGVGDVLNDFDSAYILQTVPESATEGRRVVQFRNIKRRGNNVLEAFYSYAHESEITYLDLMLSVQKVDDQASQSLHVQMAIAQDSQVIAAVRESLQAGVNTKMALATDAAKRAGISKRQALQIIERYTGEDPAHHQWRYQVRGRGAMVYELLIEGQPMGSVEP